MENIIIRPSTEADAEAVERIAREAWRPIFEGFRAQLGEELYGVVYAEGPLSKKQEDVKRSVEKGGCFVAEHEGKVVGFATYLIEGRVGLLSNNAVALRGHGIAGMLHARVFEEMKAHGCEAVYVRTGLDDAHAPARRAYEKDGFVHCLPSVTYYKML